MKFKHMITFAAMPCLLAACASPEVAVSTGQQVSCIGQSPSVGTHIVRKKDCMPLTPEQAQEERQRFEAMQQSQEMERARRATPER
jgi:hypothetical protein